MAANINIRIPEEGEKIKRLVEIAKERNIDYKPSSEAKQALREYCDRKGIENPLGKDAHHVVVNDLIPPPYNPMGGMEYQIPTLPPYGGTGVPSGMPQEQTQNFIYPPGMPSHPGYQLPPPVMGAPMDPSQHFAYYQPPPIQPSEQMSKNPMTYSYFDPNSQGNNNGSASAGLNENSSIDDF